MRWLATRLHGDGSESLIADELPVSGGQVQRALSGPGGASGTIPVEVARLQGTREAAEQAMLAVSGKSRLAYGDAEPPGDPGVLWLRGSQRVPHTFAAVLDGGTVTTAHTSAAESVLPVPDREMRLDGGGP